MLGNKFWQKNNVPEVKMFTTQLHFQSKIQRGQKQSRVENEWCHLHWIEMIKKRKVKITPSNRLTIQKNLPSNRRIIFQLYMIVRHYPAGSNPFFPANMWIDYILTLNIYRVDSDNEEMNKELNGWGWRRDERGKLRKLRRGSVGGSGLAKEEEKDGESKVNQI